MSRRHRSLWGCPPLDARDRQDGAPSAHHAPPIRRPLPQEREERRQRCGGHLRGGVPSEHVPCCHQDAGAAGGLGCVSGSGIPLEAVGVFAELRGHLLRLEERLADYDRKIARLAQEETARRLAEIPGIGP